ncbi:50S ribosomal protein L23 [Candidatus Spongiihabitans sp.]|uniref:50S ribosomal protein L23 n=1 Tax=Candidatus Spongiihabitans sp. TaxID=3101308 RepID=UPI003C6F461C
MSLPKRKSRYKGNEARSVVLDEERLYQIILKPVISEKSTVLADKHNQVVFQVKIDASKDEIRQAVEKLFEVKVKNVQVVNVCGKVKRFGKTPGARSSWKKAYVCLQEGQDIDFLGVAGA